MKVGFVGLGLMGAPMSRNLLKAGHTVKAWNRTKSKVDAFVADGGEAASSPQDAATGADVVITMVTDSPDVQAVVLGESGVVHGMSSGTVLIDMSTISPEVTREIGVELSSHGVQMLDAPVSGGVLGAQNAALSIMVGGPTDAFERVTPLFEAMGQRITYCGGPGMGQVTKLVNQVIVAGTMAAVSEGLLFGAAAGVDLEAAFKAVSGGAAASWQLENLGAKLLNDDFAPGFMVKLQQKDLRLVMESAKEMNLPMFTTPIVHNLYRAVEGQGHSDEGTQAYIKGLEALAGVKARTPKS